MFRFSRKTDCAIVALGRIGQSYKPTTARMIANEFKYSPQLTANILKELASAGLLKGIRGNRGGYLLNRYPKDITITQILEIMDGPFFLTRCAEGEGLCSSEPFCPNKPQMNLLQNKIKKLLDETNLADFINTSPQPNLLRDQP